MKPLYLCTVVMALTVFGPGLYAQKEKTNIKESIKESLPETRPAGQGEHKPSLGVRIGNSTVRDDRGPGMEYGIEYGIQNLIPYSVAVELSGAVLPNKGDQATLTRTRLFAKLNYNFGGTIPVLRYSYVGVGAGVVHDNLQNRSDVELGWAPQIGFDIPLGDRYTLGANANYLMVGGDKPAALAVNGIAKYWF